MTLPLLSISASAPPPVIMPAAQIADRVFLLNLRLGKLGTSKKVSTCLIQTDADPDALRLSAKILDCDEVGAIKVHHRRIRDHIEKLQIPTAGQFRGGMYLLPYTLLGDVESYMAQAQGQLTVLVNALLHVYEERVAADEVRLASLFNDANYPSPDAVRKAFIISYEYTSMATPEGLKRFSADVFERERVKMERQMEQAVEESKALLSEQARELAAHVADRLTPGPDGHVKVFHDSVLTNWDEFLETFTHKNITGDVELTKMMEGIREKLQGRSALGLRKDAGGRADVRAHFQAVVAKLDEIIVSKPLRKISFDEAA